MWLYERSWRTSFANDPVAAHTVALGADDLVSEVFAESVRKISMQAMLLPASFFHQLRDCGTFNPGQMCEHS